jgi:hypothetical protein
MAWGLEFDGVDDYAAWSGGSAKDFIATGDFTITGTFTYTEDATNRRVIDGSGGSSNLIIMRTGGLLWARVGSTSNIVLSGFSDGETINFTLSRASGTVTFTANAETTNVSNSNTLSLRYMSSPQVQYKGIISALNMDASATGGHVYTFDFDGSDHSNTGLQPVVLETTEGNDATGANMPTDGSAWVDLGGGGVSGTINLTLDSVTSSSSGQVGEDASGTISITLADDTSNTSGQVGLDISGSMSETLDNVGFISSGQIGDDVSGTILYTLDDGVSNSSGQVGSDVAGSINYILDEDVMTASGAVAISVTGAINYNLEGDTMNAFGIGGEDESLFTAIQLIPIQLTAIQIKQIVLITN